MVGGGGKFFGPLSANGGGILGPLCLCRRGGGNGGGRPLSVSFSCNRLFERESNSEMFSDDRSKRKRSSDTTLL